MFKNVGREIRIWAKVLVVLQMIPVTIGAVAVALAMISRSSKLLVPAILLGIIIMVVGFFIARLGGLLLYSWGEMVVRVSDIDDKLARMNPPMPYAPDPYAPYGAPTPPPAYVPVKPTIAEQKAERQGCSTPPQPMPREPEEWYCAVCGTKNAPEGRWCENCGTKREI